MSSRAAVAACLARIEQGDPAIWISRVPPQAALERAAALDGRGDLPLAGLTFAVKDNIDVAGLPTTAGCPEFAYTPSDSATVVTLLEAAGAILLGKTNLDQFATGLVGTRSPYGTPINPIDPALIPGGSSSGSAVAVARQMVSFALGTDTAGSGRIPAAFTETVGIKPTRGTVSTSGVVPACRSLDCVSVFARTVAEAQLVLSSMVGPDAGDPYSRAVPPSAQRAAPDPSAAAPVAMRIGVPAPADRRFFGNAGYQAAYQEAVAGVVSIGWSVIEVDYAPLRETAALLYAGPWIAERLVALTPFIDEHPDALLPVTQQIIAAGRNPTAADYFRAAYRLQELRASAVAMWDRVDALLVPTAGTIYTVAEVAADPITSNSNLGYYTNFVNLLDMSAVAVPAARTAEGLPFGLSLIGPAFAEATLLQAAERLVAGVPVAAVTATAAATAAATAMTATQAATAPAAGAASAAAAAPPGAPLLASDAGMELAVFGLHLQGQPLNGQLIDLGARLVRSGRTSDAYRLYVIAGSTAAAAAGTPAALDKPGAIRGMPGAGAPIELEIWRLPHAAVGALLAKIPAPLGLGTVELEDGSTVKGFVCEQWLAATARDITELGGWRAHLDAVRERTSR